MSNEHRALEAVELDTVPLHQDALDAEADADTQPINEDDLPSVFLISIMCKECGAKLTIGVPYVRGTLRDAPCPECGHIHSMWWDMENGTGGEPPSGQPE